MRDHRPALSFELAEYKLGYADSATIAQVTYDNRNLVEFVSNWKTRQGYHEQYYWIILSVLRLHTDRNLLTKEELRGKFREIFNDKKLSLDDKLHAEAAAFENSLF